MSDVALDWLDKGKIWRHPTTGHVAGPVLPITGKPNRIERALSWAILAAYVAFVLGVGYTYFRPGPRVSASTAFVTSTLPAMLVVGLIGGLVVFGVRQALALNSYLARGIAGAAIVLVLWFLHAPSVVVLLGLAVAAVAIVGHYHSPGATNDRWRNRGYRMVVAKLKEVNQPRIMPKNYTGTWHVSSYAASEWENGELVGVYFWHNIPNPVLEKGTELRRFLQPLASEKYPYGWVFDPSMPGYVPRQSDPYASPVPETFHMAEPSQAYGKPSVIPEDALRAMGAAHSQGREA